MATITVSKKGMLDSSLTITCKFTYTVSSTDTKTTLKLSDVAVTYSKSSPTTGFVLWSFVVDGKTIAPPDTISWNRTTSAQTVKIEANLIEATSSQDSVATTTANITVPALASYTVSYKNNGHGTAPSSQKKYYGIALTLASAISAAGYTFVRWNTAANNTGTGYAGGASYTANAALTLYAIWNHSVAYNANGGSGAPATQTALATAAITLSSIKPTRTGYAFKSWNTKADGSGTSYSPGGTLAAAAAGVTLYAQWEKAISTVTIGTIKAIRVEDGTATAEADEGEYAYIRIPYTVSGAASADVEMSISVSPSTATVTRVTYEATKPESDALSGTFIARASGCDLDSRYVFAVTVTATNTSTGTTQAAVTATKSVILASAFFLMDAKAGGKGIHFGGAAVEDDFWVSMAAHFNKSLWQHSTGSGRIDAEELSSNLNLGSIHRRDVNNEPIFYSETFRTTTNRTYTSFIHRRYSADGSSSINHGFYIGISNSGSLDVTFPSTASRQAWADGLFKSDNVTSNTAPSANGWANAPLIFRDKNDTEIGRAGVYFTSGGLQYASLRTVRNINGSNVYNELGLRIATDGTRSILISDGAAWRNALGINNSVSVKTASSVSVASASDWANGTTLTNSGSLAAGTYVVRGYADFATNATGRRYICISTSNTGSAYNLMIDVRNPVSGVVTRANVFGIITLTAATTLYLRAIQNSGSALSCNGRLEVLKIH